MTTTIARWRTAAEKGRGRLGHNQISSDGDGREFRKRWNGQEESDNVSKG